MNIYDSNKDRIHNLSVRNVRVVEVPGFRSYDLIINDTPEDEKYGKCFIRFYNGELQQIKEAVKRLK